MADPQKGELVPVNPATKNSVIKVNDTVNRSIRSFQNTVGMAAIVAVINKRTSLDLSVEEAMVYLAILIPVVTFLRNLAEYRNWIPSSKTPQAEIAAPVTEAGVVLGQLKS